jgi:transketolase
MSLKPKNGFSPVTSALRMLSADAVEKAKSGHPGAPMGMAEIGHVLWTKHLRHNPSNPNWVNRDRFVLSNGHGSMLIYALLHLTGYDLSIDDIKQFRQLHSRTPGHPEYGYTPGVETTTGPLGQGIANAIGMAIAEKTLAAQFNTAEHKVVDHYNYAFLGDGCLMEGVSHEACSLAGTLNLGKLIALYDDNGISIDGDVKGWFTDNTPKRFESYGWQVIDNVDGHDMDAIDAAIAKAKENQGQPTLICCKTAIGMGSPNKAGGDDVHGAPLGTDEIAATRAALDWNHAPFEIPKDIYTQWDCKASGQAFEAEWDSMWQSYAAANPAQAAELQRRLSNELPSNFVEITEAYIQQTQTDSPKVATRKASQMALEAFGPSLSEFLGGSADLAGSNLTIWKGSESIEQNAAGNYIHYGVREFGMAAIANGIALHGGFIPYTATFLMFTDYARNAMRMTALMKLRQVYVMTHDSIGLGEDGPTHQPVEQTASLRLIPNMDVWRPADATETAVAWAQSLIRNDGPSTLALTRQGLVNQPRNEAQLNSIANGGYTLIESDSPKAIIIATGSEVELAVAAAEQLKADGIAVNVVSMPSVDVFLRQNSDYQRSVLPQGLPRVAVEAGATSGWYQFVGLEGKVIGMDTFGESAPAGELFKHFNITAEAVAAAVNDII